jgi:2,4-dienoyl-CoA reductase-like NADH-dependent reductase (Old Yellow Enzyme family)
MESILLNKTTINTMTLTNRFIRSATAYEMATKKGEVTPGLTRVMVALAEGGIGLSITGHAYVSQVGQASPRQLGVYSDTLLPGLTQLVKAVHRVDGKILLQLAHAGVMARSQVTGMEPIGPSVLLGEKGPLCQELTLEKIENTVSAFRQGAIRASQAGFDGVELHAAHGWLLNQFLSPFYNKRTDVYGGNLANRVRILLETYQSIRDAVGTQFPVIIKLNSEDLLEDGFTVEEMLQVVMMLEDVGVDAIDLSGGTVLALTQGNPGASFSKTGPNDIYWYEAARRCKKHIGIPLILVGGIRSFDVAEDLVERGITDYIALSQPLIRESMLINRWKAGDRQSAQCISDNQCMGAQPEGKGRYCSHIQTL